MLPQKENKSNIFGTLLFLVLFLLFAGALTPNETKNSLPSVPIEMLSAYHSHTDALNDGQQFTGHPDLKPLVLQNSLKPCTPDFKLIFDNQHYQQKYILLQKLQLSFRSAIFERIIISYSSPESDHFPVLS
jgi:hypothetical protein